MNYYPNRLLIRGTNNHVPMYLVISKGSWGGEKKNFSRTRAMPWSKWDGVNHVWRRGAAATESALSHSTTLDAIQKRSRAPQRDASYMQKTARIGYKASVANMLLEGRHDGS